MIAETPSENLLTATPQAVEESVETSAEAPAQDGKPQNLPEKFWDAKKQEVRVDALVTSYLALEKKLSQTLPVPNTDEDRKRIYKAIGVPDTADEYQISVPKDLFDVDAELNKRLHAKGFTADQVQEVYNLAAEKMVPLILEMASEFQADRELERLVSEFGGPEKWQEMSRQLLAFGQKNLPADVLSGLASSYEGVMALHKMMKGHEPGLKNGLSAVGTEEQDLKAMMKNPKYWRDKDPAYIAQVTAGFEKIYKQ